MSLPNRIQWTNATPEHRRGEIESALQSLDTDTLLHYAYLPFAIAEVVWDYADSLCNYAADGKVAWCKLECRAIRKLRTDYVRYRRESLDSSHFKNEEHNMLLFQRELSAEFNKMYYSIDNEIYEELPREDCDIIISAHMAMITLKAFLAYMKYITAKVERKLNTRVDDILPTHIYMLSEILKHITGHAHMRIGFASMARTQRAIILNHIKGVKFTIHND